MLYREWENLGVQKALAKKTQHLLYSPPQLSTDKQLQHQTQSLHGVSLPHTGQAPWTACVQEEAVSGGSAVINLDGNPGSLSYVSTEICAQAFFVHKALRVSKK